jgi:hypothetical protein
MNLPVLLSLGSLGLCVLFFIYCRIYLRRRTGEERILAEFREAVNEMLAEIDEKTDRDALLVEERIRRLKSVLEETDRRIAVYVRELDRRVNQERAYAELGRNRLRGLDALLGEGPSPGSVPPGEEGGAPAEDPRQAPLPFTEPRFTQAPREIPPRERSQPERIMEMARAGFSPQMIAPRLGLSVSEVELVIAIGERKNPQGGAD